MFVLLISIHTVFLAQFEINLATWNLFVNCPSWQSCVVYKKDSKIVTVMIIKKQRQDVKELIQQFMISIQSCILPRIALT